MSTLIICRKQIKNILLYPITLLTEVYSLIVAGTGKIRAALFSMNIDLFAGMTAISYTPPAVSLLHFPAEILHKLTEELEPADALAFIHTCFAIRNLYTPAQIAWLGLEKQCSALISKSHLTISDTRILRRCYQEALSRLLDDETSNKDLKHIAAFTEKFYKHLPSSEIKKILDQVLRQRAGHDLHPQFEKLARINFHLCVTLCCIATFARLAQYGIKDRRFLSGRFSIDHHTLAENFLSAMEKQPCNYHNTALGYATVKGYTEVVSFLLKASPNCIDVQDKKGNTALIWAAISRNRALVHLLLEQGACVNVQNTDKETALFNACSPDSYGHIRYTPQAQKAVIQRLLQYGAKVDIPNTRNETALMRAAEAGNIDTVHLLLKYKAAVDLQDTDGMTAVMHACIEGNWHSVKALLKYGADVSLQNKDGHTALMMACDAGSTDTVQLLLKQGTAREDVNAVSLLPEYTAYVNLQDEDGNTALIYACDKKNREIIQLLLKHGADTRLQNSLGETALMKACMFGRMAIVQLLLQYGAETYHRDHISMSALFIAQKNGYTDIVRLLESQNHFWQSN